MNTLSEICSQDIAVLTLQFLDVRDIFDSKFVSMHCDNPQFTYLRAKDSTNISTHTCTFDCFNDILPLYLDLMFFRQSLLMPKKLQKVFEMVVYYACVQIDNKTIECDKLQQQSLIKLRKFCVSILSQARNGSSRLHDSTTKESFVINDPLVRSGYSTFYILLKTKQNKKKTFSMWRTLRNQRQATETNSLHLQVVISDALDTVRIAASNLNALIGVIATKNAWNELRKLHALVMHNEIQNDVLDLVIALDDLSNYLDATTGSTSNIQTMLWYLGVDKQPIKSKFRETVHLVEIAKLLGYFQDRFASDAVKIRSVGRMHKHLTKLLMMVA